MHARYNAQHLKNLYDKGREAGVEAGWEDPHAAGLYAVAVGTQPGCRAHWSYHMPFERRGVPAPVTEEDILPTELGGKK